MSEAELSRVPLAEIARVLAYPGDKFRRAQAFAALCRINTLYMIAYAGSGHIGSSFSSIDIVSWLHLEELRGFGTGTAEARDLFCPRGTMCRLSTPSSSGWVCFPTTCSTPFGGWTDFPGTPTSARPEWSRIPARLEWGSPRPRGWCGRLGWLGWTVVCSS